MTSCKQSPISKNVSRLLILALSLTVAPGSLTTTSPSASSQPASPSPSSLSATREPDSVTIPQSVALSTPSSSSDTENTTPSTSPDGSTRPNVYTTTESPHTSTTLGSNKSVTTSSVDHKSTKDKVVGDQPDPRFRNDEYELRKHGLISALILCVIGILVLTSGKCRGLSCRRRRGRTYNVMGYKPQSQITDS
ncbi:FXYD domain-containing ion transport regulator 5-like isoform X2 [Pseudophryne corroboree]|uniref:FXYD domain-containing ion transport regulator 5-like isoform X2 n=1 Tax=Pseudophryne corroboree TaxID=495146 RepID=UPI0030816F59